MKKLSFIKSDILKINIIIHLSDEKSHTPSELATKLNTNNKTILRNSKFLEFLGLIEIDVKKTIQYYYYLNISKKGLEFYNGEKDKITAFTM